MADDEKKPFGGFGVSREATRAALREEFFNAFPALRKWLSEMTEQTVAEAAFGRRIEDDEPIDWPTEQLEAADKLADAVAALFNVGPHRSRPESYTIFRAAKAEVLAALEAYVEIRGEGSKP